MNTLQDLGALKQQWQAGSPPLPDVNALRERLAVEHRAHWRVFGVVLVATVAVIATTLYLALRSQDVAAWFGFGFTVVFAAVVWLVALILSRGTWRPRDASLAAHLDLSIRRCRSVIVAAPIGILLYLAGLAASLAWKQQLLGREWTQLLESPSMIVAGWIGAPLYALGMLWNARRHRQRLQVLQALRRRLSED